MHQKNFVICDVEFRFAENFLHMVAERKDSGINLHLFQDLEQLEDFSRQQDIHFLLLDGGFPQERRRGIKAEQKFVLVRSNQEQVADTEIGIEKYQSVEKILCQIFDLPQKKRIEVRGVEFSGSRGKVIGVYSPIHRIGKTKFAIELGKELAGQKPVLYLNLEGYSGECYFQEKMEQDLSNLLYYARQEQENLGLRISMMAGQLGNMDYIEPMAVVQDLHEVKKEEWKELFERILNQCIYDVIILDLGDGVNGLYEILNDCDTVYTLYAEDSISRAKMKQYTKNLIRTGHESVLEHTIQKKVIVH